MYYEKKYKDALRMAEEIIRYYKEHNRGDETSIEDLEQIFPELAESEDERIRKALVRFHKSTIDIDGIKGADILAWLEKQGKQKHPVTDFKANNWYVSKVDGKIHDMTYNPTDKVEPKFKVKYAGSEYNVFETKDIAGVPFYGIEDELNHIDYVKAENCETISGYTIKENGSPYPTKSAVFSEQKQRWSEEDDYNLQCMIAKVTSDIQKGNVGRNNELIDWLKSLKDKIKA